VIFSRRNRSFFKKYQRLSVLRQIRQTDTWPRDPPGQSLYHESPEESNWADPSEQQSTPVWFGTGDLLAADRSVSTEKTIGISAASLQISSLRRMQDFSCSKKPPL